MRRAAGALGAQLDQCYFNGCFVGAKGVACGVDLYVGAVGLWGERLWLPLLFQYLNFTEGAFGECLSPVDGKNMYKSAVKRAFQRTQA